MDLEEFTPFLWMETSQSRLLLQAFFLRLQLDSQHTHENQNFSLSKEMWTSSSSIFPSRPNWDFPDRWRPHWTRDSAFVLEPLELTAPVCTVLWMLEMLSSEGRPVCLLPGGGREGESQGRYEDLAHWAEQLEVKCLKWCFWDFCLCTLVYVHRRVGDSCGFSLTIPIILFYAPKE